MNVAANESRTSLYTSVWRWHFYAGLFAAPFLLILSITGAIYLFNDELDDLIYPEFRFAAANAPGLPPSAWIESARAAFPGYEVSRVDGPTAPGRTAMLFLESEEEPERRVFVDPSSAKVAGSTVYTKTLVGFADVVHGTLMLGNFGSAIVELAAGWSVVLVVTGLYLWWPRGRERINGVVVPRLQAKGRTFWRDLHKVTGLYAAGAILFLLLTGLPWAAFWGGKFLTPISNALGVGYPQNNRDHGTISSRTVAQTIGEAPWTLQQAPMPASDPAGSTSSNHAHHGAHLVLQATAGALPSISLDEAVHILALNGIVSGYRLTLPKEPEGVFTAYTYPDRPEGQRTIHLDRYTGEVLGHIGFKDYGPVAKAVEWGVALHMGNYFGRANQIVMLLTCLAIVALVVTGIVMWWKRRPAGGLGAPKPLAPLTLRNAVLITILLGVFFPLVGASLVIVLVLDLMLRWTNKAPAAGSW